MCLPNKKAHRFRAGSFEVSLDSILRERPLLQGVMPMVQMGVH
jgi:hypothetical protein